MTSNTQNIFGGKVTGGNIATDFEFTYGENINAGEPVELRDDGKVYKKRDLNILTKNQINKAVGISLASQNNAYQINEDYLIVHSLKKVLFSIRTGSDYYLLVFDYSNNQLELESSTQISSNANIFKLNTDGTVIIKDGNNIRFVDFRGANIIVGQAEINSEIFHITQTSNGNIYGLGHTGSAIRRHNISLLGTTISVDSNSTLLSNANNYAFDGFYEDVAIILTEDNSNNSKINKLTITSSTINITSTPSEQWTRVNGFGLSRIENFYITNDGYIFEVEESSLISLGQKAYDSGNTKLNSFIVRGQDEIYVALNEQLYTYRHSSLTTQTLNCSYKIGESNFVAIFFDGSNDLSVMFTKEAMISGVENFGNASYHIKKLEKLTEDIFLGLGNRMMGLFQVKGTSIRQNTQVLGIALETKLANEDGIINLSNHFHGNLSEMETSIFQANNNYYAVNGELETQGFEEDYIGYALSDTTLIGNKF